MKTDSYPLGPRLYHRVVVNKVIDFLAEIELGSLRSICLLKVGLDGDNQRLETPVAEHRHAAVDLCVDVHRNTSVVDGRLNLYVRIEDLLIPEAFKELLSCRLPKGAYSPAQFVQIYYKGLQS